MDKRKKPHTKEHKRKISEAVKKQHAEGRTNSSGLFTKEAREKARQKMFGHKRTPIGKKHWSWKGEEASYAVKHIWLSRYYKKVGICEHCKKDVGIKKSTGTEWANISGKYYRKREDYMELCHPCHIKKDFVGEREANRRKKLSKSIKLWWKNKKVTN